MKKKNNGFKDGLLKEQVKEMINTSKKLKLIKSVCLAFESTPCEAEEHKGKKYHLIDKGMVAWKNMKLET